MAASVMDWLGKKSAEAEPASETIQQLCSPASAGRVPFEELWRLNPRGWIGRARTAWLRLSDTQTRAAKADLEVILRRGPLPEGFDYAATHFAMIRRGQPAAPILAPTVAAPADRSAWVWLHSRTPEFRAWQRHLMATIGRGTPTDSRDGWLFPSKLPPLADAEAAAPARVAHSIDMRWPAPALCGAIIIPYYAARSNC